MMKSRMTQSEYPMNIFYIIGVIVVILFVAGFLGLHAWAKSIDIASEGGRSRAFPFRLNRNGTLFLFWRIFLHAGVHPRIIRRESALRASVRGRLSQENALD
jgi:hypothetical protein